MAASSSSSAAGLGVLQRPDDGGGDLPQVVRGDVGGHPDGDPGRAVDQQVRESGPAAPSARRSCCRSSGTMSTVFSPMPVEHQHGQLGQPALGVPHGGGRVVAHRPEIALTVDHRIPQRPRLGHPDHGVVDRGVAVRVIVAHHVADHPGRLHRRPVRPEPGVVHAVQHPAVHRLEPVPDVRQRPGHDHAHRVVDERALHLLLDVDRLGAIVFGPESGPVTSRPPNVTKPSR